MTFSPTYFLDSLLLRIRSFQLGTFTAGLILVVVSTDLTAQEEKKVGTITSSEFSVGVGFSPSQDGQHCNWNTLETESANAPLGGDFQVAVDLTGNGISKTGPKFKGRVLSTPIGGEYSGSIRGFSAAIKATYQGEKPKDAAEEPNYRIRIRVSQISVYAAASFPDESATAYFEETTPDHSQTQEPVEISANPEGINALDAYQKLEWEPVSTENAVKGATAERSFVLRNGEKSDVALDGFEVVGEVVLEYDKQ